MTLDEILLTDQFLRLAGNRTLFYGFDYSDEKNELLEEEPDVYLIAKGGDESVSHQYNCLGCNHLEQDGVTIYAWRGAVAEQLQRLVASCGADPDKIEPVIRVVFPDARIVDCHEALVEFEFEFEKESKEGSEEDFEDEFEKKVEKETRTFWIATINCD